MNDPSQPGPDPIIGGPIIGGPVTGGRSEKPLEITTFFPSPPKVVSAPSRAHRPTSRSRNVTSNRPLGIVLFLTTCVSVFAAGLYPGKGLLTLVEYELVEHGWVQTQKDESPLPPLPPISELLKNGFIYFGAVMTILVAHEMGHYLQARRYRVPASMPYFIPFPISPFGTMGAVIFQQPGVADRKSLFDIAISGPLAGLVFALPITVIGIAQAHVGPAESQPGELHFVMPLVMEWIVEWTHGPLGPDTAVADHPLALAGWVGIFITALNLIPISQLDGGHILYTLIGRRAHVIAAALLAAAMFFIVWTQQTSYIVIVLLLLVMGPRHPPTSNDDVPLGIGRIILGWLTLAFLIIGFTPVPIKF